MNYQFKAVAEDRAELRIDGEIGSGWFSDEDSITSKQFSKDLKAVGKIKALDIYINSTGGSVIDGQGIYSQLKRHKARKTVYIDGMAASIASVIAMAGDEIVMPENSLMMIHCASGGAWGNAADLRKLANTLEKVDATIIAAYQAKTGREVDELNEMMADETWLTAQEAVALGFADRTTDAIQITACAGDLSRFKRFPSSLIAQLPSPEVAPVAAETPDSIDSVTTEDSMTDAVITPPAASAALPDPVTEPTPAPDVAPAASESPAPVAALDPATLRAEFIAAEQQRRAAIRALIAPSLAARADLRACLDVCLDDPSITPDQASRRLLAAIGHQAEALALPVAPEVAAIDANAPLEDRCKAEWQRDPKLRAEFADSLDTYLAYCRANANGQVRIFTK